MTGDIRICAGQSSGAAVQTPGFPSQASKLKARPIAVKWHDALPIYAGEGFLRSESKQFGWVGSVDEEQSLRCILPYNIVQKAGFRLVRFRTETIPVGEGLGVSEEQSFLNSVVEYFRTTGADLIIPSGNTALFRTYPEGAVAAPYGTYVKDLGQTEEALMGEIHKTFRYQIRKAAAAGVQIKCGPEYLEAAYRLIAETLKRSKVSFKSYREFAQKMQSFGEYVRVFVAEYQGGIHACMVAPFSRCTAYNCYAGTRTEPVLGAMHLLHWEAIRYFRSLGVRRFDFQGVRINPDQGSKQAGISFYKKSFGGALVTGFQWKYSLRPLKSLAYSIAVRLLMGGDIVDQEQCKLARDASSFESEGNPA